MTDPDIAALAKVLTKAQDVAALADPRWIPGYEGTYFLTDIGEVFSVPRVFVRRNREITQTVRVPGRKLRVGLTRKGYLCVRLSSGGCSRSFEVHRLVCRVYHGEPLAGQEAAHGDGDRSNARASNMRWATRSQNHADKRRHGTHVFGEAVPNRKLTATQAAEIYRRSLCGESMRALGREYRVDEAAIRKIKNGTLWAEATASLRAHLQQQGAEA